MLFVDFLAFSMFSSSQRLRRKRGIILSSQGWQRLKAAQEIAENIDNEGLPYTLEDLNELTGLSCHTLIKVRRQQHPVDKQTLEDYFSAFNLKLTTEDYVKPISTTKTPPAPKTTASDSSFSSKQQSSQTFDSGLEEPLLPQGQVPLNSKFYIERLPLEKDCYKTVLQPGSLIKIKAPRKMGKTSLIVRILSYAAQQGCQTVFLSLQLAERNILQNLAKFLQWFSVNVGLGMHQPNRLSDYWDDLFGSKISCKMYFEQYLLANSDRPLVLALDDADRLFDYPELADEFFGLLRTWHEQAKNHEVWQQLRLIVAHSNEVYTPLNANRSPFNVGLPIELGSFTQEQIGYLAQQYGLNWSQSQSEQLMAIANGQPYLVQLGLYALWQDNISLEKLLEQAIQGIGIYADCLQRLRWALEQDPKLSSAFARVLQASDFVELELSQAFRLKNLGLVQLRGNRAIPSCALYADYFRGLNGK